MDQGSESFCEIALIRIKSNNDSGIHYVFDWGYKHQFTQKSSLEKTVNFDKPRESCDEGLPDVGL